MSLLSRLAGGGRSKLAGWCGGCWGCTCSDVNILPEGEKKRDGAEMQYVK